MTSDEILFDAEERMEKAIGVFRDELRGLRTGRLLQRGPHHRIDRHRQPVRFWSTIALCGAASLIGFVMLAAGLMRALT